MADEFGHAKGQDGEVGAAQVQHQRAHEHRQQRRDQRSQRHHLPPGPSLDQQRAGVGTDAEEGRRGQRQVASGATEQRPTG